MKLNLNIFNPILAFYRSAKIGFLFFLFGSNILKSQITIEEHINPFNKTYLQSSIRNADLPIDNNNLFIIQNLKFPTFTEWSSIFKRNKNGNSDFKPYPNWTQTRFFNLITDKKLTYYYAFQNSDSDVGCAAGGVKIMRLNKNDLSVKDSTYFCHPVQDYGIFASIYAYSHFYYIGHYSYEPYLSKSYNTLKAIDTNLVTKHFNRIDDSTSKFGTTFIRKANNDGLILVGYEEKNAAPSIIKLDTLGNKIWQKRYYTYADIGTVISDPTAFSGMQPYNSGYIVLVNTSGIPYPRSQSFILKLDNNGNKLQEMQYSSCGDTMLDIATTPTFPFIHRTQFKNVLIKTNDGNFASVINASNQYGYHTTKSYIVVLDSNLNIIHRSPSLGNLYGLSDEGMCQGEDGRFYFAGGVMNSTNDGMNIRVYTYKIGDTTVTVSDEPLFSVCSVYPNPSAQNVTIEYSSDTDNNMLKIYDMLGHLVLEQNLIQQNGKETVITENLSVGVYTYQLVSQTKIIHQGKLVLTR